MFCSAVPFLLCAYAHGNVAWTSFRMELTHERHTSDSSREVQATDYEYDSLGHLKRVKDPRGSVRIYTYDQFGNRTPADDPDLGKSR